jgi:hypothetical protein
MKRAVLGLSLIVAAAFGVVAAAPASAIAADSTANLTLNCNGICIGRWTWYQGATALSSGSISGANDITRGSTVQPATADTVIVGLSSNPGPKGCGTSEADSFSPGSHINVTVKLRLHPDAYHNGCFATFNMTS